MLRSLPIAILTALLCAGAQASAQDAPYSPSFLATVRRAAEVVPGERATSVGVLTARHCREAWAQTGIESRPWFERSCRMRLGAKTIDSDPVGGSAFGCHEQPRFSGAAANRREIAFDTRCAATLAWRKAAHGLLRTTAADAFGPAHTGATGLL